MKKIKIEKNNNVLLNEEKEVSKQKNSTKKKI